MEEKRIKNIYLISLGIDVVLGILLHFTYDFFGENKFVGAFSAVNESVWEHLKLVFFPMLVNTIITFSFFKNKEKYICSKLFGMLISMTFIITFFYTYTGILGNNYAIVDILSFFVSVIFGEFYSYKIYKNKKKCESKLCVIVLFCIFVLFIIFTFNTPKLNIFIDPVYGKYGIF